MSRNRDPRKMDLAQRLFNGYCPNCAQKSNPRSRHYAPSMSGTPGGYTCEHVPWPGELTPVSETSTVADTPSSAGD